MSHPGCVASVAPAAGRPPALGLRDIVVRHGERTNLAVPALAVEPGERPTASPLARLQASRHDSLLISTLLHTDILIEDPLGRYALQLLDGTRDRAALLADLRRWVQEQGGAVADEVTGSALAEKLRQLARLGLLIA